MGQEMQFFMFVVNCKDRSFFLSFLSFSFFLLLALLLLLLLTVKKNRDFVSCVTGFLVVVVNVVDDGMHKILPCC